MPSLWQHPAVTHQERKEILRCLIDHIVVAATDERLEATISGKLAVKRLYLLWRGAGRKNLISELHERGLAVSEIQKRLAAGQTSTGQSIKTSKKRNYERLHKAGFKPSQYSAAYLALREKAAGLNREGQSPSGLHNISTIRVSSVHQERHGQSL